MNLMNPTIHELIIIWSWPAWHTAAIYAARSNLKPVMFEWWLAGGIAAGGQLTTTTMVENFPWRPEGIMWPELMDRTRQQSINNWVQIYTQTVDRVDFSDTKIKKIYADGVEYVAKTIIIATGATAKILPIIWLKEYWMSGISWCAVCDGAAPIFRRKPLAVIGGGDVAMEEAIHLSKFGSKIYILVRSDKLRASKAMQDKVLSNEKIEILRNTECLEAGSTTDLLEFIKIKNNLTWEQSELPVNGLFFAIWHTPATWFLNWALDLDDIWYIIVEKWTTKTSVPWVFAAGDVQDHIYRQAITSAGSGCMASLDAEKRLNENE